MTVDFEELIEEQFSIFPETSRFEKIREALISAEGIVPSRTTIALYYLFENQFFKILNRHEITTDEKVIKIATDYCVHVQRNMINMELPSYSLSIERIARTCKKASVFPERFVEILIDEAVAPIEDISTKEKLIEIINEIFKKDITIERVKDNRDAESLIEYLNRLTEDEIHLKLIQGLNISFRSLRLGRSHSEVKDDYNFIIEMDEILCFKGKEKLIESIQILNNKKKTNKLTTLMV